MFGLSEPQLDQIKKILKENFPDKEIWVFGSRAGNQFKKFSDLDIAIIGNEQVDLSIVLKAKEAFQSSDLPIKIDLVDFSQLTDVFKENIKKNHIVFKLR